MYPSNPDCSVSVCCLLNLSIPLILVTSKLLSDNFKGLFLDISKILISDSQGTMLNPELLGSIYMFACIFETPRFTGLNSAQESCMELVLSLLLYQNLMWYQIKCFSEVSIFWIQQIITPMLLLVSLKISRWQIYSPLIHTDLPNSIPHLSFLMNCILYEPFYYCARKQGWVDSLIIT